jgi:hypothetical protein
LVDHLDDVARVEALDSELGARDAVNDGGILRQEPVRRQLSVGRIRTLCQATPSRPGDQPTSTG